MHTNTFALRTTVMIAVALGLSALALTGCKSNAQPPAALPPEVGVIDVTPRSVTVYNEYVAPKQAPDTIEIRSQVTGLLERQAFSDGARVKKGDLLYVIDRRPFEAQRAQAKASVAQAEANLLNANQNLARNGRLIFRRAGIPSSVRRLVRAMTSICADGTRGPPLPRRCRKSLLRVAIGVSNVVDASSGHADVGRLAGMSATIDVDGCNGGLRESLPIRRP